MSDYFTGCEVCEANARTYGVMTAEYAAPCVTRIDDESKILEALVGRIA